MSTVTLPQPGDLDWGPTVNQAIRTVEAGAKEYADTAAGAAESAAKEHADTAATTAAETALSDAKSYTDEQIGELGDVITSPEVTTIEVVAPGEAGTTPGVLYVEVPTDEPG